MKLYRLKIAPSQTDGEGENHDEWFTLLSAAKIRRRILAHEMDWSDHRYGQDFAIEEVEFVDLPPKKLLLAILNRTFVKTVRVVVAPIEKPR